MPASSDPLAPPPQRTCEQKLQELVAAIRNPATTMEDLTHMVGPDPVDAEKQAARSRIIDGLWARAEREDWGCNPAFWPAPHHHRHLCLRNESYEFEKRYC